ncbi:MULTISPECIES: cyclic lactone autoinducer peptide [Brevibacillus]|nr:MULTISPECIES: cyclic lactone autoinducer peptide [Brevibacillus]MBW5469723.1 cyclic lactone autoinducer peptide [Brevibacillus formosus]MED1947223.1 cyclic lactone autoinducer peptide [Brevibacillus formosus]MED1997510.1 cyclic lactone autoinducer peptide [Brevibacillus formosus]MED2083367.1 cyclic lactone autoinducer peptide [Brevibacillus formosus]PSK16815.1 cyclic lactone autoinducer peptide [Brevibacillus sp. NRRL NRS-603]
MKNKAMMFVAKHVSAIASFVAVMAVSTASFGFVGKPEIPEELKK